MNEPSMKQHSDFPFHWVGIRNIAIPFDESLASFYMSVGATIYWMLLSFSFLCHVKYVIFIIFVWGIKLWNCEHKIITPKNRSTNI